MLNIIRKIAPTFLLVGMIATSGCASPATPAPPEASIAGEQTTEPETPAATPGIIETNTNEEPTAQNNTDDFDWNDETMDPSDIPDDMLPPLEGSIFEVLKYYPVNLLQLSPPAPGEELVTLHTSMGDITMRLFPEEAPMAVENFLTHARNGYYDDVIFHRVIPEFMIQTGDPEGTGMGGESIWGEPFWLEPSFNLRHFRGALAMAHAGGAMNSQFYIVQNTDIGFEFMQELSGIIDDQDFPIGIFEDGTRLYIRDVFLTEEIEYFKTHGGTPHLDWLWNQQGHTVFGHVVSGMDVVDAIANAEASQSRPYEDIIIHSISFTTN